MMTNNDDNQMNTMEEESDLQLVISSILDSIINNITTTSTTTTTTTTTSTFDKKTEFDPLDVDTDTNDSNSSDSSISAHSDRTTFVDSDSEPDVDVDVMDDVEINDTIEIERLRQADVAEQNTTSSYVQEDEQQAIMIDSSGKVFINTIDIKPKTERQVTAIVRLWRNGFNVDNGPLRDGHDPTNSTFLKSVEKLEIPQDLRISAGDALLAMTVIDRKDEDFKTTSEEEVEIDSETIGVTEEIGSNLSREKVSTTVKKYLNLDGVRDGIIDQFIRAINKPNPRSQDDEPPGPNKYEK